MKVKFIDLFCGMGSFHYSFSKMNMKCVFACDIDKDARQVYKDNYGLEPKSDIRCVKARDIPKHDVLCAGIPCQSFSIMGQRKGFESNNGDLFFEVLRIIDHHKSKVVIIENVMGLLTIHNGNGFSCILNELEVRGYSVQWKVLRLNEFGIPQTRRRVFIIATLKPPEFELLDFDIFKQDCNLSDFLNVKTPRKYAMTVRASGLQTKMYDYKYNKGWNILKLMNGTNYIMTTEDVLRLQGFPIDFQLNCKKTKKWRMLGNTIPIPFTEMISWSIHQHLRK